MDHTTQILHQISQRNPHSVNHFVRKPEVTVREIITHRPCEAEREAHWVGEAVRVGLRYLEGVRAKHGGHGTAVRAGRVRGDVGLVVLQTNPKESLALALLVRMSSASGTAVGIPTYSFFVEELLQFELKHSRTQNLQRT